MEDLLGVVGRQVPCRERHRSGARGTRHDIQKKRQRGRVQKCDVPSARVHRTTQNFCVRRATTQLFKRAGWDCPSSRGGRKTSDDEETLRKNAEIKLLARFLRTDGVAAGARSLP